MNSEAKYHEIQHLLIALDKLGYTDLSLSRIESQKNPLSWILCDTADKKFSDNIPELVSTLEHYFIKYGLWDYYQHFIFCNGFNSLLTFSNWKLY